MDATERFVNALTSNGQKVKGAGRDMWRATCPAHKGEDLNLAVAKGDQGVLVKCWSQGCAEYDIASSLGLTLSDLFDRDGQAVYDYGGGHRVYRTRTVKGKKIRQENSPEVTHLYVPEGSLPIASSDRVVIGEGEKTADALVRLGAKCVATWPGGSSAVGKVDLEPLRGKRVTLIPDNDEPGVKAAATLLWRLQGVAGAVETWRVPEMLDGKPLNDAADLLLAGGQVKDLTRADVTPVDEEFEAAVADRLNYLRVVDEAKRRDAAERAQAVSTKLAPRPLGDIVTMDWTYDWVIPDLLERQDRLVVTGSEGFGKSVLLRQIAICAAAGIHPFAPSLAFTPARVLVIDAENSEKQWSRGAQYVTRLAGHIGTADPAKTVMVSAGVRVDLTATPDVNQVHRLLDEFKPDLLYIGPLYKLVPRAVMTDDDAAPLIQTLDGFRERGITLLMEAHAGHARSARGDRDLRPRGSSALLGWPEFGFGLRRFVDEDENGRPVEGPESDLAWLEAWRGQREHRHWPKQLRRGVAEQRELPWEVQVPWS